MTIRAKLRLERPAFALDVDLDIPDRGITAVFGPSGSGKTTLLRCIAGLERALGGHVMIGAKSWQDDAQGIFVPTHRRPLGYVFQEASLFAHLSVRDNLAYGMKRVAATERRVSLAQATELLGIDALLERVPGELSGGERQRVAIARALLTSPELLLMDEPLAALDLARKNEILPYLERLHDELAMPVIYVSHAADEVARLADHIVVMAAGRSVAQGPLAATLARLDLPLNLGDNAGVVIDGNIAERDDTWHLARVAIPGGELWVRDKGLPVGKSVRVRILARDVSIANERVVGTSILNTLPATVVAFGEDDHPAHILVRLQVGASPIVARVTKRSADALGLTLGQAAWVQIKAVALIG